MFQSKEEQLAIMTKATDFSGWVADPQGINTAGWSLFITPTEMAKIGQLYLNRGAWNGKQLISAEWINERTREHSRWNELGLKYGYLWWVIDEEYSYTAMADGGNRKDFLPFTMQLYKKSLKSAHYIKIFGQKNARRIISEPPHVK